MAANTGELGELQLTVMNVLWTLGSATVHEMRDALAPTRTLAYTTVLTVLRNLEKRGMVAHTVEVGSRTHRFRPVVSSHDTREAILQDILNRLFAGSPALLIKHLLTTEGFTVSELRDIRRTLEAQENQITGGGV
jgi:BlaI family transcriptional regulator, penicillinase repressor